MVDEIKQIKPETEEVVKSASGDVNGEVIPKIEPSSRGVKRGKVPFSFKNLKKSFLNKFKGGVWMKIGVVLGLFLVITVATSFLFYSKAKKFASAGQRFVEVAQAQDIIAIKGELEALKKSQKTLSNSYILISWMRVIPFVGRYVGDVGHGIAAVGYGLDAGEILLTTVEPYTDLLGFTNGDSKVLGEASDGAQTTQERIDFIISALPDLIPQVEEIATKVSLANVELIQIDPDRYPEVYDGKPVREPLRKGINLSSQAEQLLGNIKPILEQADYLLGMDEERTYFVLFQNDKELRPTGGFMTAYSIMKVEDARFEPVISSDIYSLDTPYKPVVKAPGPIITYLKGPYIQNKNLRLRDMNWSPDFKESMDLFSKEAEKVGIKDIDGIISVDTQLLVYLLDALGEIGVSGFGNFSTKIIPECNCPQVIYELESFADVEGPIIWDPLTGEIILRPANSDNRKRIIGPLMNSIFANALGQPKDKLAGLFEAGFKSIMEKHVMFYLFDEEAQKAVEDFGIAGRIKDYDGDYLHINDSNLGGRKSNLYVTQEVEQDIEVFRDGSVTKTVTITYKNPEKHDGWLNSLLPNWTRIYVPLGSELIDISGLEETEEPYEEFGKTVFAGFFELRPEGVSKVTLTYKLPDKVSKNYNLLIQKQPGTDMPLHVIRVGKNLEEFFLKTDKELRLHI